MIVIVTWGDYDVDSFLVVFFFFVGCDSLPSDFVCLLAFWMRL